MEIIVFGVNHQTAALELRERFALAAEEQGSFLELASRLPHVEECLAVSTCNRVELYAVSPHPSEVRRQLARYFAERQGVTLEKVEEHFYFYEGQEALRHGFKVAASLDSMVVGESQILGQMKDAYRRAQELGTTGKVLNKFFHHAFFTAKKIRSETAIAEQTLSISSTAVVLAKQIFGSLEQKSALILGAGKMSELAIRHLKSSGVSKLYLANRTPSRAQELAERVEGEAIPFENFSKWLVDADIVISSTHAPGYLIEGPVVQEALKQRKSRPIFFIDLAVPRDIAPEVNQISGAFLYDIDDLGEVVKANREERLGEAERAMLLLDKEVEAFLKVLKTFEVAPTLSSLSRKFEGICRVELEKALQKLPNLDAEGREAIEAMATSIVKKVLHDPMVVLKENTVQEEGRDYPQMVRRLFRLDEI